jgi:plasmid stabilization system protein ParE
MFDRYDGDVVQILRILHGRRDLLRIMQDEAEE